MVISINSTSRSTAKLYKLKLPNSTPLNYDRDGEKNTSRS